jgi:cell division septum initiation protein DivIVA
MMVTLFDSTKKALTKRPSTSNAISYHPLQDGKPRGDTDSRRHESPKREPIAVCTHMNAPVAAHREKDVHTQTFQPTREPMHVFPTQIIHPESIHVPSYRVRQTSMVLSKEKIGLQGQLLAMQDALDTALNTSEARRKEIRQLKEELQRLDSIVTSMVSAEKVAENKICHLERKVLRRNENIRNLEQKLRISQEQRSQTTKLLDDRTAELKGAQAFLTTADRYSGADIIKMAESLNAEIFQASALMAELLVDAPVVEDSVQQRQDIQKYAKRLEHGRKMMPVGSRLFDHLATKSREIRADPLPLQLAFQALFTSWCVYEVHQFCEGPVGESLTQIYDRIYKSGKSFIRRHPDTSSHRD